MYYRAKWINTAYPENNGTGPPVIKDLNFVERNQYGFVDQVNNSIIPNEDYMVDIGGGRVFDFVADSFSLAKLNLRVAAEKGMIVNDGGVFSSFSMVDSYKNPKVIYGEYLEGILQYYNETHIPNIIGKNIITSYERYVNHFFNFFYNEGENIPLTMTKWNTSYNSSVLNTGVAFSYRKMPYDADQRKENEILSNRNFNYFKNLCLNMSFCIVKDNPNILCYDLDSPAGASIRYSYDLISLETIFRDRFIMTFTIDLELLFLYINLNYNKYVLRNREIKIVDTRCRQVTVEYIPMEQIDISTRPYSDEQELELYMKLRNVEEGHPFSQVTLKQYYKKSIYFLKTVDKGQAMSYINSIFRDQIWNKDHGYHDLKQKLSGRTTKSGQTRQTRGGPSTSGTSY